MMNLYTGAGYEKGFYHFWRDHSDEQNFFLHCLVLVLQLGGNFGFLGYIEKQFFGLKVPYFSAITGITWAIHLCMTDTPIIVKVFCVISLFLAFQHRHWVL